MFVSLLCPITAILLNTQFKNILTASTLKQRNDIAKEYGLRTSLPILNNQLQRECHLQSLQDIYHLVVGKTLKLLKLTISMLSPDGQRSLEIIQISCQCQSFQTQLVKSKSFMMSDHIQLGMMTPFILNRSLTINCLKPQEIERILQPWIAIKWLIDH